MDIKNNLINIMNEAKQLNSNDIETIPGTKVAVRKGRAEEFKSLAYLYYQQYKQENNIIDLEGSNFDYITEVYNILEKEANPSLEDDKSIGVSYAFDLTEKARENADKLTRLNNALDRINANYEKFVKQANDLQSRLNSMEYSVWKSRFDEISASISEYAENKKIVTDAIIGVKKEMNEAFLEEINKQLASIREDFTRAPKVDKPVFGKDGYSILPSQEKDYNSLLELVDIINNVREEARLVPVNGVLCVNIKDTDNVNRLLGNIENLKFLSKPDSEFYKENNSHINDKIIEKIWEQLRGMERKSHRKTYEKMPTGAYVNSKNAPRYLNLLEILKVLNRANASDVKLAPVWGGVVSVLNAEQKDIIKLMRKEELFNANNPDYDKKQFNEKMIKELEAYLLELEKNYTGYVSYTNIPSRQTTDDKIVLESDYEEYETIYKMLEFLKANREGYDLENVWGLGYVSRNEMSEYKRLLSKSKKYSDKEPKIPENDVIIKRIYEELEALNETAKSTKNPVLASDKPVLATDEEEYDLLIEQLKFLNGSVDYKDLESIKDGSRIASRFAGYYRNVLNKLEDLRKNKGAKKAQDDKEETLVKTREKLDEITNKINALATVDMNDPENKAKLETLEALKTILENAQRSNNLKEVNGIMIDADDEEKYNDLTNKLQELEKPKKTPNQEKLEEITNKINALATADMNDPKNKAKLEVLEALKILLENAQQSNNLKEVNGIMIDADDEKLYNELIAELQELENVKKTPNEIKLDDVNRELQELGNANLSDEDKQAKEVALNNMKSLLEKAEKSSNLKEIDGIKIDADDEEKYKETKAVLDDLDKKQKGKDKKKFKFSIRKLGSKALSFIKEHRKVIMATCLAAAGILLGGAILVDPLIYACNYFGGSSMMGFVNFLCNLGLAQNAGGAILSNSGLPLSMNFATERLLGLSAMALIGAGTITAGGVGFNKLIKKYKNDNKPSEEEKKNRKKLSEKVLGFLDKIKSKRKAKSEEQEEELDFTNNDNLQDNIEKNIADLTRWGETISDFNKNRFNILTSLKNILDESRDAYDEDLVDLGGLWIKDDLADDFAKTLEALSKLETLMVNKTKAKLHEVEDKYQKLCSIADANADIEAQKNYLLDMKAILENSLKAISDNQIGDLVEEKDVLVGHEDADAYDILVDKLAVLEGTKATDNKPDNSTLNQDKIDEIDEQLKVLKKTDFDDFDSINKEVILTILKDILKNARKSNDLVDHNGVMIDSHDIPEYDKQMDKLKELEEKASKNAAVPSDEASRIDSAFAEASASVDETIKQEDDIARKVQERAADIAANPENDPAIANVTGTSIPEQEPVPAPEVDPAQVVDILENDTKEEKKPSLFEKLKAKAKDVIFEPVPEEEEEMLAQPSVPSESTQKRQEPSEKYIEFSVPTEPTPSAPPKERSLEELVMDSSIPPEEIGKYLADSKPSSPSSVLTDEEIEKLLSGYEGATLEPTPEEAAAEDKTIEVTRANAEKIQLELDAGGLTPERRQELETQLNNINVILDTLSKGEGRGI